MGECPPSRSDGEVHIGEEAGGEVGGSSGARERPGAREGERRGRGGRGRGGGGGGAGQEARGGRGGHKRGGRHGCGWLWRAPCTNAAMPTTVDGDTQRAKAANPNTPFATPHRSRSIPITAPAPAPLACCYSLPRGGPQSFLLSYSIFYKRRPIFIPVR